MKNTKPKNIISQGFSLIEMLVVIAVIGVIAAIAIPSISGISDAATKTKDQRNAQNIVSVFQAGVAAGATWDISAPDKTVADVVKGKTGTGAFATKSFSVPGLSATEQTNALKYIDTDANKALVYNKDKTP
ncbi:prepilin-type N-terminal cleavage/methylation domain-containing protein [Verrucomicrobium sp. BvORR106]|uniref:type II secretion system protein n=1 Tax=Verrucomicrobium sp. BvORR106 TaxID=1403819 RepID=UPI000571633E|nr:prepilin-type N-terminal cleavage/methylation domain-containing protein [Verrucomicrobium sp. BvORR106]